MLDVEKATVEEVKAVVKLAEKRYGPIDILFNNAGVSRPGMFFEVDALENAKANMDLNYYGSVKMVSAVGKGMMDRGKGRIVLVGSVCSFMCIPGPGCY